MKRLLLAAMFAMMVFSQDAFAIYDPGTGRFITRDPAGYVDGMNLYRYGRSNPLRYNDPSGLSPNFIRDRFNNWVIDQFDDSWDVKDFIYHYYGPGGFRPDFVTPFSPANFRFGTGDTVDLGEVGRGEWYKNKAAVKKLIEQCRKKARQLKEKMDAGGSCDPDHSRIDGIDTQIPGRDFEDPGVGFVIGTHDFKCDVQCTKESGQTKCKINYGMEDRFEDPADIPNKLPVDIEPGGTPYDIIYDWTEDYP